MSRLTRAVLASLALAVLVGGLALPLASLALDEPAPFCCRGRCCCTGEPTGGEDDRPCLRAACHCGQPGAIVLTAPLRLEAVLPVLARPAAPASVAMPRGADAPRPPARADEPPVPPPRRVLPA
jgi:hypothetical protein